MQILRLSIFLIFAVVLSIYDIKFLKVPVVVLLAQIFSLVIFDFFLFRNNLCQNGIGAVSCFSILLLTYFISKHNLGFGDVEFGFSVGWLLGDWLWIPALIVATALGIVFILVKNKAAKNKRIPFVPFLGFSSLCIGIFHNTNL